jgi:hypothetical protein
MGLHRGGGRWLHAAYHAGVDHEAWARAEMAKAAADPGAFERRLKERLERRLAGRRRFQAHDNDGVWVEEVRMEGSYPDTTGAIILRDDRQPGCRFAWSLGELWDWRAFGDAGADPDEQASWIEMNLDEDVEAVNYGIPIRCIEGELTFVGRREVSLTEPREGPPSRSWFPPGSLRGASFRPSTRSGAASSRSRRSISSITLVMGSS